MGPAAFASRMSSQDAQGRYCLKDLQRARVGAGLRTALYAPTQSSGWAAAPPRGRPPRPLRLDLVAPCGGVAGGPRPRALPAAGAAGGPRGLSPGTGPGRRPHRGRIAPAPPVPQAPHPAGGGKGRGLLRRWCGLSRRRTSGGLQSQRRGAVRQAGGHAGIELHLVGLDVDHIHLHGSLGQGEGLLGAPACLPARFHETGWSRSTTGAVSPGAACAAPPRPPSSRRRRAR